MKLSVKKRFFKFLKDEGIWHLYWYNVRLGQNKGWKIEKIYFRTNYFIEAFFWKSSELFSINQKPNFFWRDYDEEWLNILISEGYLK